MLSAREGGPAWKSGIRGTSRDEYGRLVLGDIITAINGKGVRNSSDLYRMLDKATVSGDAGWDLAREGGGERGACRCWCALCREAGGSVRNSSDLYRMLDVAMMSEKAGKLTASNICGCCDVVCCTVAGG